MGKKKFFCKDFDSNKTFAKSLSSEGYSQPQISKIMGLTKKCVWYYINEKDSKENRPRRLSDKERKKFDKEVGKPNGHKRYSLSKGKMVKFDKKKKRKQKKIYTFNKKT